MAKKVYLHGDATRPIVAAAAELLERLAPAIERVATLEEAELAIAPLLRRRLTADELRVPTLIFHPSLLPRRRGRDAIRWAIAEGDPFSGVTWFWASRELDEGDVCEIGVVEIHAGEAPRAFYERAAAEGLRLLEYALLDFARGVERRRPQRRAAASYDPPFETRAAVSVPSPS